jgi:hypothetical protein
MKNINLTIPKSKLDYTLLTLKEKFEDTKRVIRSLKSKTNRQYNGKKRTTSNLQNITQKTKD